MSTVVRGVALAALSLSLACQDSSRFLLYPRGATPITEAATLAQLHYSGFIQAARQVIANQQDWEAAWAQLYATHTPKPALPAVDFGSERVILAALGNRNTGGYSIHIDAIETTEDGSTVFITTVEPGSSCGTTQALTQPVHAVRVPTPPGPVRFEQRAATRNC